MTNLQYIESLHRDAELETESLLGLDDILEMQDSSLRQNLFELIAYINAVNDTVLRAIRDAPGTATLRSEVGVHEYNPARYADILFAYSLANLATSNMSSIEGVERYILNLDISQSDKNRILRCFKYCISEILNTVSNKDVSLAESYIVGFILDGRYPEDINVASIDLMANLEIRLEVTMALVSVEKSSGHISKLTNFLKHYN